MLVVSNASEKSSTTKAHIAGNLRFIGDLPVSALSGMVWLEVRLLKLKEKNAN
jgi:hypothetical protein